MAYKVVGDAKSFVGHLFEDVYSKGFFLPFKLFYFLSEFFVSFDLFFKRHGCILPVVRGKMAESDHFFYQYFIQSPKV